MLFTQTKQITLFALFSFLCFGASNFADANPPETKKSKAKKADKAPKKRATKNPCAKIQCPPKTRCVIKKGKVKCVPKHKVKKKAAKQSWVKRHYKRICAPGQWMCRSYICPNGMCCQGQTNNPSCYTASNSRQPYDNP
ncbi:MAG: hypothetical protein EP343_26030 [Deltaproteobacteria bacterium]|nr:MAG: hypothetical protein EP343_26030 [Deltaproteobacteria bacterium]